MCLIFNILDAAGTAGSSVSGDAEGGNGRGYGPGGNAYTGDGGRAAGDNVVNNGGTIGNAAMSSKSQASMPKTCTDGRLQMLAAMGMNH